MRRILAVFLMLNSFMVFSADVIPLTIHANQQLINVILPANPTTGYQWTVKHYNTTLFKLIRSQYVADESKRIGSGGHMTFVFSCLKATKHPKSTVMLFRYARRWEHGAGIIQKVLLNFK